MFVILRHVFQNLGKTGKNPTVASSPEVFFAIGAFVFGVYIFGIAIVQAFVIVVHDTVAYNDVIVQFVEVFVVAGDIIHLGHHRHYHIQTVRPPPIVVGRGRHLVLHYFAGAFDAAVVGQYFVKVGINLEAYLPVAEEHMVVRFAVLFVSPLAAVFSFCTHPQVVLGPFFRIITPVFIADKEVCLHITGVIGRVVPEGSCLCRVGTLPVVIYFGYDIAHGFRFFRWQCYCIQCRYCEYHQC